MNEWTMVVIIMAKCITEFPPPSITASPYDKGLEEGTPEREAEPACHTADSPGGGCSISGSDSSLQRQAEQRAPERHGVQDTPS